MGHIGHFMKSFKITLFPYILCYIIEGLSHLYHGSVKARSHYNDFPSESKPIFPIFDRTVKFVLMIVINAVGHWNTHSKSKKVLRRATFFSDVIWKNDKNRKRNWIAGPFSCDVRDIWKAIYAHKPQSSA